MRTATTLFALLFGTTLAHAGDIPEPPLNPVSIGDSWTFKRVAKGEVTVQSRIIFKIAQQGPDNQYVYQSLPGEVSGRGPTAWRNAGRVDMDACMIDFFGGGTLGITHSCSTSFEPGMDWNTEQTDKGTRTTQRYQVVGPEEVTVGAGTFQAIKIESHWEVAKALNAGKPPLKYGAPLRYHFVYWYVPETKTMVKTEREFRNLAGAVDTRSTDELEAFRVHKPR
jgi:hypothetical protein